MVLAGSNSITTKEGKTVATLPLTIKTKKRTADRSEIYICMRPCCFVCLFYANDLVDSFYHPQAAHGISGSAHAGKW